VTQERHEKKETDMLKVWGRRSSFNLQKVMWLIGELDLPHEHIDWGGAFGGLDDPAFLAMNPHGRIPVIRDGEAAVWESHTILRYLAARYGQGRFWSDDPVARARVEGLDGLVADGAAAGLSGRRVLGIFPHPARAAQLACDQGRAGADRV
jgi:glutathione S-transferase